MALRSGSYQQVPGVSTSSHWACTQNFVTFNAFRTMTRSMPRLCQHLLLAQSIDNIELDQSTYLAVVCLQCEAPRTHLRSKRLLLWKAYSCQIQHMGMIVEK